MPARFSDLMRVLRSHYRIECKPHRGGSSHWKATAPNGVSFIISAHKGPKQMISDGYIEGACRRFGINKAELWKLLRD